MRLKTLTLPALCLLASLSLFTKADAQTQPSYVPQIIPPSPNAASLMKFTDLPVSPYTGTSDVSVPIYTIQAKGLSIPISLDYHTGGIRLNEESGWVGLGWALNSGGMISRTIRDKDDFTGTYFAGGTPIKPGDLSLNQPANAGTDPTHPDVFNVNQYLFFFGCSYLVNYTNGTSADYTTALVQMNTDGHTNWDLEPDSYSYNFLGQSGKFIIKPDKSIVLEKQDNIRIQLVKNGPGVSDYVFIVTDDQGNRYYFNDREYGGPASGSNLVSSWHLSKIVTQQNDVVTFTYTANGSLYVPEQQVQAYNVGCSNNGPQSFPTPATLYTNSMLQTIDFTNGQVQFVFDNVREDQQGGSKLNAIKVYSKSTAGLKYLKEHDLYYSYFGSTAITGQKLELERLKLDSVKEAGTGIAVKPYSFAYNMASSQVGKHIYDIDHWGYYNGTHGNATLIPTIHASYSKNGSGGFPVDYSGAERSPDASAMQLFSLQQVTYPTGGKSVFAYSANEYDYYNSLTGPNEYTQLDQVTVDTSFNISSFGTTTGTFNFNNIIAGSSASVNVAFVSTNYSTGWPSNDRCCVDRVYFQTGGLAGVSKVDLSSGSLTCGGPACSGNITIPMPSQSATGYTWTAYVSSIPPADFSLIRVTMSYQAYKVRVHQTTGIHKETAGGLRISSITDYSDASTIAKKRVWDYGYTSGADEYTYGRLMAFPSYIHKEIVAQTPENGGCPNMVLFGSCNSTISSTIQGNIVGYSKVTERTVDPATNADIGKTVYSFYNAPDSVIFYNGFRPPGTSNMGNHLNGAMLSRKVYRNTGGNYFKVNETYNYYHTANRKAYFGPKIASPSPSGSGLPTVGYCVANPSTFVSTAVLAYFYPIIKSERVLQDSTREFVYDQNDTTRFQLTSSKSFYDNPVHYQLTRNVSTDSRGNKHVSKITYPQDYIVSTNTGNAVLDTLIGKNMLAVPIEKRDSLYYSGSPTGYMAGATVSRYKQLASGAIVADKQYKLDVMKPVTDFVPMTVSGATVNQDSRYRQLISFDGYDGKNNIAQYTVTGQLPVSVLWDYRWTSPIAQVKNADTTSIAYTSFEGEGKGRWTVPSALRDSVTATISGIKSYNLSNGAISKAGLTAATTYIVSYWTKNATPLTITGTISGYPVNGIATKGWYYHEHRVTGLTTVTLTGTGNIDEVRLYPLNAQMVSYTYTPLIGVSGSADARGGLSFYDYDGLLRLLNVRDQDGNILKSYDYHYRP
jgi:hypothetical protein